MRERVDRSRVDEEHVTSVHGSRTSRSRRLLAPAFWLGLGLGLAACGAAANGDDGLGRSGWFGSCESDAECAEGQCLCGVCTVSCAESACAEGPPNAVCLDANHWAQVGLCAGRATAPVCASGCDADTLCPLGLDCVDGICLPGPAAAIAVAGGHGSVGSLCETDPVVWRSLEVSNQRQLDALRGCERVEGDLTISLFADADQQPLSSLRVVTGRLTVTKDGSNVPEPLRGLEGIERLGGLALRTLTLSSLAPLAHLTTIWSSEGMGLGYGVDPPEQPQRGSLEISYCKGLESLEGLDGLEELGSLVLVGNPDLVSPAGLTRLRQVQDLALDGPPLRDLHGLEQVAVRRSLSIRGMSNLSDLRGLGDTSGLRDLLVERNSGLTSLRGLTAPRVMNNVFFDNNPALLDASGLEGLTEVSQLRLSGAFTSLSGLDDLTRVGMLSLWLMPALSNLTGLGALTDVDSFNVEAVPSLASFDGLAQLARVGWLKITDAEGLVSLRGLGEAVIDSLEISKTGLVDLDGLAGASVAGLSLSANERMTSLAGFPTLAADGSIDIAECRQLANFDALTGVTSLVLLHIAGTGAKELDGLANLERVGDLFIDRNNALEQIDGLAGLASAASITISRSPALRTMPVFSALVGAPVTPECPECVGITLTVSANDLLVQGPVFPLLERAERIEFWFHPLLESLAFPALRSAGSLSLSSNERLATLDFGALQDLDSLWIRGNLSLAEEVWAPLAQVAPPENTRIVSNLGGPSRLDPCPWAGDGVCDELDADCAPGTDAVDCSGQAITNQDPAPGEAP